MEKVEFRNCHVIHSKCAICEAQNGVVANESLSKTARFAQADDLIVENERLRDEADNLKVLLSCTEEIIRYCREELDDTDAAIFLRLWSDAEWEVLREEFPDADDIIYAADPAWSGWKAKGGAE